MPTLAERQRKKPDNEQLLKLYWNRAGVKRELNNLRSERYELLDKLKEQEDAAQDQEAVGGQHRLQGPSHPDDRAVGVHHVVPAASTGSGGW